MAAAGSLAASLRSLSISHCGDVGAGDFLAHLTSLTRLEAAFCRSLQEDPHLLAAAPRLEALDLTGVDGAGDALCSELARAADADLSFLPLTDAGLAALASRRRAPRLRRLTLARRSANLWETGRFRDEALAALRRARPELSLAFKM